MSEDTEQAHPEQELNRLRQENQQMKMQIEQMRAVRANMEKPFDELREQNAQLIQAVSTLAKLLEPKQEMPIFFSNKEWPK